MLNDAILLGFAGMSVQTSQAGENAAMAPPEFLRLQYSTDPPLSAENSREATPEQTADAAQTAPAGLQVCQQQPAEQLGNLCYMCHQYHNCKTIIMPKGMTVHELHR